MKARCLLVVAAVTFVAGACGSPTSPSAPSPAPPPAPLSVAGAWNGTSVDSQGTTLTMNLQFAAGVDGDPTPICSATMAGAASSDATGALAGSYTGSDSCEGAFLNGTLAMTRK